MGGWVGDLPLLDLHAYREREWVGGWVGGWVYLHEVFPRKPIFIQEGDSALYIPLVSEEVDEAGFEGGEVLQAEGGGGGGDARGGWVGGWVGG